MHDGREHDVQGPEAFDDQALDGRSGDADDDAQRALRGSAFDPLQATEHRAVGTTIAVRQRIIVDETVDLTVPASRPRVVNPEHDLLREPTRAIDDDVIGRRCLLRAHV